MNEGRRKKEEGGRRKEVLSWGSDFHLKTDNPVEGQVIKSPPARMKQYKIGIATDVADSW
jgi:hypothetical protein